MKYPFLNCEHPVKVIDHVSHVVRYVPCGHCHACALQKAKEMTTLCDLEEDTFDYCFFITCTYDREHLPLFRLDRNSNNDGYDAVNLTSRMNKEGEVGNILFSFNDSQINLTKNNRLHELCMKVMYSPTTRKETGVPYGCFPYINSYEVIKFRTRLRTYLRRAIRRQLGICKSAEKDIDKYGDTSFRYIITREYGPTTFRPHFHMLLFTNSSLVAQNLRQVLYKAWPYGDIKLRKSDGQHQSYLTAYVNNYFVVPDFLKARCVRPSSIHSQFFGALSYTQNAQTTLQRPNEELYPLTISCKGQVFDKRPWLSLQNYLFPRCSRYANKSLSDKLASYTIYQKCSEFFGEKSVTKLANILSAWLIFPEFTKPCARDIYNYFLDPKMSPVAAHVYESRWLNEKVHLTGSIISELYKSKQFYKLQLNGLRDPMRVLDRIDSFFSFKQLTQLSDWYNQQDEFYKSPTCDKNLFPYFYSEFTLWSCADSAFRNQKLRVPPNLGSAN